MGPKYETIISTQRVIFLGLALIGLGMLGFYLIPGLIADDALGSKIINSFYCSVITLTTIGFGDICPGSPDTFGRVFLTIFPVVGLGFFCGPILDLASSWRNQVPGGPLSLVVLTLAVGVAMFTFLEDLTWTESLHFCVVIGTTIGYGDITPSSNLGRFMVAIYAVLVLNVMGGLLSASREYLESFCRITISPIAPVVRLDDVLADKPNKKNKKSKKNKVA